MLHKVCFLAVLFFFSSGMSFLSSATASLPSTGSLTFSQIEEHYNSTKKINAILSGAEKIASEALLLLIREIANFQGRTKKGSADRSTFDAWIASLNAKYEEIKKAEGVAASAPALAASKAEIERLTSALAASEARALTAAKSAAGSGGSGGIDAKFFTQAAGFMLDSSGARVIFDKDTHTAKDDVDYEVKRATEILAIAKQLAADDDANKAAAAAEVKRKKDEAKKALEDWHNLQKTTLKSFSTSLLTDEVIEEAIKLIDESDFIKKMLFEKGIETPNDVTEFTDSLIVFLLPKILPIVQDIKLSTMGASVKEQIKAKIDDLWKDTDTNPLFTEATTLSMAVANYKTLNAEDSTAILSQSIKEKLKEIITKIANAREIDALDFFTRYVDNKEQGKIRLTILVYMILFSLTPSTDISHPTIKGSLPADAEFLADASDEIVFFERLEDFCRLFILTQTAQKDRESTISELIDMSAQKPLQQASYDAKNLDSKKYYIIKFLWHAAFATSNKSNFTSGLSQIRDMLGLKKDLFILFKQVLKKKIISERLETFITRKDPTTTSSVPSLIKLLISFKNAFSYFYDGKLGEETFTAIDDFIRTYNDGVSALEKNDDYPHDVEYERLLNSLVTKSLFFSKREITEPYFIGFAKQTKEIIFKKVLTKRKILTLKGDFVDVLSGLTDLLPEDLSILNQTQLLNDIYSRSYPLKDLKRESSEKEKSEIGENEICYLFIEKALSVAPIILVEQLNLHLFFGLKKEKVELGDEVFSPKESDSTYKVILDFASVFHKIIKKFVIDLGSDGTNEKLYKLAESDDEVSKIALFKELMISENIKKNRKHIADIIKRSEPLLNNMNLLTGGFASSMNTIQGVLKSYKDESTAKRMCDELGEKESWKKLGIDIQEFKNAFIALGNAFNWGVGASQYAYKKTYIDGISDSITDTSFDPKDSDIKIIRKTINQSAHLHKFWTKWHSLINRFEDKDKTKLIFLYQQVLNLSNLIFRSTLKDIIFERVTNRMRPEKFTTRDEEKALKNITIQVETYLKSLKSDSGVASFRVNSVSASSKKDVKKSGGGRAKASDPERDRFLKLVEKIEPDAKGGYDTSVDSLSKEEQESLRDYLTEKKIIDPETQKALIIEIAKKTDKILRGRALEQAISEALSEEASGTPTAEASGDGRPDSAASAKARDDVPKASGIILSRDKKDRIIREISSYLKESDKSVEDLLEQDTVGSLKEGGVFKTNAEVTILSLACNALESLSESMSNDIIERFGALLQDKSFGVFFDDKVAIATNRELIKIAMQLGKNKILTYVPDDFWLREVDFDSAKIQPITLVPVTMLTLGGDLEAFTVLTDAMLRYALKQRETIESRLSEQQKEKLNGTFTELAVAAA